MIMQSSTARISALQNGRELAGTRFGGYHNYRIPCDHGEVTIRFENLQGVDVDAYLAGGQPVTVPANGTQEFPFAVTADPVSSSISIHWAGPRAVGLFFIVEEALDEVEIID